MELTHSLALLIGKGMPIGTSTCERPKRKRMIAMNSPTLVPAYDVKPETSFSLVNKYIKPLALRPVRQEDRANRKAQIWVDWSDAIKRSIKRLSKLPDVEQHEEFQKIFSEICNLPQVYQGEVLHLLLCHPSLINNFDHVFHASTVLSPEHQSLVLEALIENSWCIEENKMGDFLLSIFQRVEEEWKPLDQSPVLQTAVAHSWCMPQSKMNDFFRTIFDRISAWPPEDQSPVLAELTSNIVCLSHSTARSEATADLDAWPEEENRSLPTTQIEAGNTTQESDTCEVY